MELGIYTFADVGIGKGGVSAEQRIPELLEEISLADEVGLDVFGIGEHHREGFGAPAPEVILGAAAVRTKRIRLTSAVTVLSSDEPVRVFERFTAVDLLSSGRAEVMVGRGALLDSFRIFGYDLADYDALFREKLELLLALRKDDPVTWSGRCTPQMTNEYILPRPVQPVLPVWLAVGGNPDSVVRAGQLGLPMALAMLGGQAHQFAPMFDLHREVLQKFGHAPQPAAITMHGFVADSGRSAADIYFPADAEVMNRLGAGRIPTMTRELFDSKLGRDGAYMVGSPDEIIDKILHQRELFGHQRTLIQLAIGSVPHVAVMQAIELLGSKVVPQIRAATGDGKPLDAVA